MLYSGVFGMALLHHRADLLQILLAVHQSAASAGLRMPLTVD
jgi:hypothetical protein